VLTATRGNGLERESEVHRSGDEVGRLHGPGSLRCVTCGYALSLAALEELPSVDPVPTCPACGGTRFRRVSIFEQPTIDVGAVATVSSPPAWLDRVRSEIEPDEPRLAYVDGDDEPTLFALPDGWTRIGRSATADLRLDDPTVSRRHALVVRTDTDELRALDDRSLNGLFVNGERVEWAQLADGDELEIGRYRLYVIEVSL
jgi:FHA domain-containing protein/zinc ribbon family protein